MGVPVIGMGRLFPQEIREDKPVAQTCEKCGAPLRSNKCEYCGTEYASARKQEGKDEFFRPTQS